MTVQPHTDAAPDADAPSTSTAPGTGPERSVRAAADRHQVRRALVSVYDKTGLEDLARALAEARVEIVSTGSTAALIADAGIPVTPVEAVTGFPECLDGRVKTLHPNVHAGVLADRRRPTHREQLDELGIEPFDLVIVNLYPFAQTVASGAGYDAAVEQIDIGGPTMVRAAAKNHPSVAVVVDPGRYGEVVAALDSGGFTFAERRALAADAFAHTASYDSSVASWFAEQVGQAETASTGYDADAPVAQAPGFVGLALERRATLRYGENPHQAAALYAPAGAVDGIAGATQLQGKAMSYNNYVDADAALRAALDHERPAVAIIKHANPCGIAVGRDVEEAYRAAHACDPVSAYGGVIAVNRPVTAALARAMKGVFTEVLVAPEIEPEAVEVLSTRKNLRVLTVTPAPRDGTEIRLVTGGALVQARDAVDAAGDAVEAWTHVAGEPADEATLADLEFAWRSVRSVRSNAVLLADAGATVGVGMGQVNRVDSCRLAVERANTLGVEVSSDVESAGGAQATGEDARPERARGAVAASDAFFPFADGLQVLLDAGVRAVVHPGGSIRDDEVTAAAQAAGVTMYLTGTRHFAH